MSIYTIGDLHLSFNENKPMGIFGENWLAHEEKIRKSWIDNVYDDDLIILPGDFSWSTYLKDTLKDFEFLNQLPGKKLLIKGNHDYWWTTLRSMRNFLCKNGFNNIDFIYNNSYEFENKIIVGTRGWCMTENDEDRKLVKREALRLELSIKNGLESFGNNKEILVFMHYPPIVKDNIIQNKKNEFIDILGKYNIKKCYYGHLHSSSIKDAVEGIYFDIDFKLVSADGLNFELFKIC